MFTGRTHPRSEYGWPCCVHSKQAYSSDGLSKLKRLNAQDIKDLISYVLQNENFNRVDHNMHDRLRVMCAVADEMDVHEMWQEGDGKQDVKFFKLRI